MKIRWAAIVCVLTVTGCASDDDTSSSKLDELESRIQELEEAIETSTSTAPPATTTTSSTTTVPPTTTEPDRRAEAAVVFTDLVDSYCDPTMVPPGHTATIGEPDGPRFPVTDADGALLRLDIDRRVVTSPDGDGGVLPRNYSFGCDPDVFLGTLPH